METEVLNALPAAQSIGIWSLFWQSDLLVKLIMLGLVMASVWSWAVIFDKFVTIRNLSRGADKFEDDFWSGQSLDKLYEKLEKRPGDPMAAVFVAGMREWRRSKDASKAGNTALRARLLDRIERVMGLTIGRELERSERYMIFLASLGAVAPFVGLFGTVWGIIHSFSALAGAGNASIAAIAPGMAEALFTTAMGLVAAIPAVVAYNKFASDLGRHGERLEAFATEFSAILGRYMEEN